MSEYTKGFRDGWLCMFAGFLLATVLGCASNLSIVKRYDPETGKIVCSSRISSRILGTGETEMAQANECGGDATYSTRDTGISDNARRLGVEGIKVGMEAVRPGGAIEGAIADRLSGDDDAPSD